MKSKRLNAICSFLTSEDKIIDIGCDHAYVLIEMKKRNASILLGTEIHEHAYKTALENIRKNGFENQIFVKLTDGLKNVDVMKYNTLILAGMGYFTIEHILEKDTLSSINKIILEPNKDEKKARILLENLGFFLEDEKVVFENHHYYTIMCFKKGKKKLNEKEIEFGLIKKEKKEYFLYIKETEEQILKKIPKEKKEERKKHQKKINMIQQILNCLP